MIQETIKIHDKYQFELKLGYGVSEGNKDTVYNIEIYFFIPNNLDVNSHTYGKNDFYNDLQTYIRFKTPNVLLRNIENENNSPFDKLKLSFENLSNNQNQLTIANYTHQIKMFCCILKSALRDHVNFISTQKKSNDIEILINEYIKNVQKINIDFRELHKIINIPNISGKIYSYYLFSDEYISHIIEEYSYNLLQIIKKLNINKLSEYNQNIYNIIKNEIKHREENKFPSIPKENSDNEELIFRKSVLKKYIGSILFLKTRSEKQGVLLEQILFGIAAALSMMFATAVAFFSQIKFGAISLPLFIILTISYMFKDRIKELLRLYFAKKIQKIFFDHKINLYTSEKEKIGWTKELFYFIKEKNIPKEVIRIRNRDHITEIENGWMGEKTAVYIEQVKLFAKKLKVIYKDYNINGINNIMRFDITKFLSKMDNPKKEICIFNENDFKEIYGERVYHLNLVIKYSLRDNTLYKRFRIVLNRDGIKRIEEIFSEKKNGR